MNPWSDLQPGSSSGASSLADLIKMLQQGQNQGDPFARDNTQNSTPGIYQGFGRDQANIYGAQELSTARSFADNLPGLLKSFAGARYNFEGTDLGKQTQQVGQIDNLSNAMVDENSPEFQQIYGQQKQAGQQNLAEAIAEMSRQNRKLSSMGRTPLFSSERGGETQFRELTRGYQDIQNTARDKARSIIGAGQNAKQNAFSAQNQLAGAQNENQKKQAFGLGNIADVIPLLFKFWK